MKPPIKKYNVAYFVAELSGCKDHPNGCYIKLINEKVKHSRDVYVVLDFDKDDDLVGIDFQEDLKEIANES